LETNQWVWQRRHTKIARHGHPGQAYRTSLALAEWLCRTADLINVRGPFFLVRW
jgi:hypothetical protein